MATELTSHMMLPARREDVGLHTDDGLTLVGELALPDENDAAATLVMLHPLPTHGGSMDSHLFRKVAWRLPALADIAVLRFNTRGTASVEGRSEGEFDAGVAEAHDVAAAVDFAVQRGLPKIWLVGWSFGTELALKYGCRADVEGAILLAPPLHRTTEADLRVWAAEGKPLTVLVPEFDDYLRPVEARERFAVIPQAEVIGVEGAKHLWVGEKYVRIVLDEIAHRANPAVTMPLPTMWDGPYARYRWAG